MIENKFLADIAADPGISEGWVIVIAWMLIAKWGWLIGGVSFIAFIPLRTTTRDGVGCLLGVVIFAGMILFVTSAAFQIGNITERLNRPPDPPIEIRKPVVR